MTQVVDSDQRAQTDDAQWNGRVPMAGTVLHDDVEDCH